MSWNDERTFPEVGYIRSDGDLVANCDTRVRNGKRRRVACDIAAESAASDATCWFTRRGRYGAHHRASVITKKENITIFIFIIISQLPSF